MKEYKNIKQNRKDKDSKANNSIAIKKARIEANCYIRYIINDLIYIYKQNANY